MFHAPDLPERTMTTRGATSGLLLLLAGLAQPAPAQQNFDTVQIRTVKVADGVYMLMGSGGNIGVSAGPNGVVIIDDQFAPLTPKIKAAVAAINSGPIRFLLNRHWHWDHTGGNENMAKDGVVIVAHENVRHRLSVEQFVAAFDRKVPPSPEVALPIVTFTDAVSFYLNGDSINAFHVAPAHTDGDVIIWFRHANVVHMGDTYVRYGYPFIDLSSGGSVDGMVAAADKVLALTDARPPAKYKVGLVQMAMSADPDENLQHAIDRVEEAARQGARLVCLPELFRSRYFAQVEDAALFDLAEPVPGPSTEALGKVARRAGVVVIAPLFERRAPGLYHNTAAVIDADGRLVGLYRKMHIPDDPAYYEKFYFAPGDLGFRTFDTQVGRIGTLVCWDQWYPEGARLTALQGAHILFYPTAIGWHPRERQQHGAQQLDAWRTIQRSHAIANGLFVAAVNRVGHERPTEGGGDRADGIEFWGSSFLADPFGVVVMEAPRDREAVLVAEVDLARIEEVRRSWPFLRDRRIDAYAGIGERFLDNAPPLIADS